MFTSIDVDPLRGCDVRGAANAPELPPIVGGCFGDQSENLR